MRAARLILSACDGKDRRPRITQQQARELILPHMQCLGEKGFCPQLVFWEPVARSLNMFFLEED